MTDILQKFREEARLTKDERMFWANIIFRFGSNVEIAIKLEEALRAQLNKALSLRLNDDYKPDPKGRYVLGIVDLEGEAPECEYYYTGEAMEERCPLIKKANYKEVVAMLGEEG